MCVYAHHTPLSHTISTYYLSRYLHVGRRRPLHWDAPPSSCPANANLGGDRWMDR